MSEVVITDSEFDDLSATRLVRALRLFHFATAFLAGLVVLITLVLSALTLTTNKSGVGPELFQRHFLVVTSGSMEPSLQTGALAVTRRIDQKQVPSIPVGTVVAFRSLANPRTLIMHRVVARTSNSQGDVQFVTKGDANVVEDSLLLNSSRVVGTLSFSVSHAGYLVAALEQGQLLQLVVLAFLLASIAVVLSKWAVQPSQQRKQHE